MILTSLLGLIKTSKTAKAAGIGLPAVGVVDAVSSAFGWNAIDPIIQLAYVLCIAAIAIFGRDSIRKIEVGKDSVSVVMEEKS